MSYQQVTRRLLFFEIKGNCVPVTVIFSRDAEKDVELVEGDRTTIDSLFVNELGELLSEYSDAICACFPLAPGAQRAAVGPDTERLLSASGLPISGTTLTGCINATCIPFSYNVLVNNKSARFAKVALTARISTIASRKARTLRSLGWTK